LHCNCTGIAPFFHISPLNNTGVTYKKCELNFVDIRYSRIENVEINTGDSAANVTYCVEPPPTTRRQSKIIASKGCFAL
jgi:hypothetical protein